MPWTMSGLIITPQSWPQTYLRIEGFAVSGSISTSRRCASKAKPSTRKYVCGHDCGVMINPDIVHGMTYGGIAHGIGAALYEKFSYTEDGQLASGTFMDYLIPSAMEVPSLAIVDH